MFPPHYSFYFNFKIYFHCIWNVERNEGENVSICWLTPHMPVVGTTGPKLKAGARATSGPAMSVTGPQVQSHHLLPVWVYFGRKLCSWEGATANFFTPGMWYFMWIILYQERLDYALFKVTLHVQTLGGRAAVGQNIAGQSHGQGRWHGSICLDVRSVIVLLPAYWSKHRNTEFYAERCTDCCSKHS